MHAVGPSLTSACNVAMLVSDGPGTCRDEGADPGIALDVSGSTVGEKALDHMICVFQELHAAQMRLHRLPAPGMLEGYPGHSLVCQKKVWWLKEPGSLEIGRRQPGYPWLTHLCLARCAYIDSACCSRLPQSACLTFSSPPDMLISCSLCGEASGKLRDGQPFGPPRSGQHERR